jgi:hypothetical protein
MHQRTRSRGSSLERLFDNISQTLDLQHGEFDPAVDTRHPSESDDMLQPSKTAPPMSPVSTQPLDPLMHIASDEARPRARSRTASIGLSSLLGSSSDALSVGTKDFTVFSAQVPDLSLSLNKQEAPKDDGGMFSNHHNPIHSFDSFDQAESSRPFGYSFSGDDGLGGNGLGPLDTYGGRTPLSDNNPNVSWDNLNIDEGLGASTGPTITVKREPREVKREATHSQVHIPRQRAALLQPAVMRATFNRPGRRRRFEEHPVACAAAAAKAEVSAAEVNAVLETATGDGGTDTRTSYERRQELAAKLKDEGCDSDDDESVTGKKRQIGAYTAKERKAKIARYLEKRSERVWRKKIEYGVRKDFANSRVRVGGRFVGKRDEVLLRDMMGAWD